uniref:Uncharacterized protein n=1 Tax=Opuntia streptacantha TaxID=393608 RepID=A0A7C9CFU8_OPUST
MNTHARHNQCTSCTNTPTKASLAHNRIGTCMNLVFVSLPVSKVSGSHCEPKRFRQTEPDMIVAFEDCLSEKKEKEKKNWRKKKKKIRKKTKKKTQKPTKKKKNHQTPNENSSIT